MVSSDTFWLGCHEWQCVVGFGNTWVEEVWQRWIMAVWHGEYGGVSHGWRSKWCNACASVHGARCHSSSRAMQGLMGGAQGFMIVDMVAWGNDLF